MKTRAFVLLLILSIGLLVGVPKPTSTSGNNREDHAPSSHELHIVGDAHAASPDTIDGAVHPELIPDNTAYLMLFRLLANRTSDEQKKSIRDYVRNKIGLGKQPCHDCTNQPGDNDADIDALLAAAEEFNTRITVLDNETLAVKDRAWPSPTQGDMATLDQLQKLKESLISEMAASVQLRLSVAGRGKLQRFVVGHIKTHTKLTREPATPPTSTEWQPGPPKH